MRILIDLDSHIVARVEALALQQKRARKNMIETIIEERVKENQ